MTFTARPTTYRGIPMRSRLEARFAAHLDSTGLDWVYEPRAYASADGQYLPDFEILAIKGKPPVNPFFIEVKPTIDRAYAWMPRMQVIWESEPDAVLSIAVGSEAVVFITSRDKVWRASATESWTP